jgi:hypothetical protein
MAESYIRDALTANARSFRSNTCPRVLKLSMDRRVVPRFISKALLSVLNGDTQDKIGSYRKTGSYRKI